MPFFCRMKPLLLCCILLVWMACSAGPKAPLQPAFFCWETTLNLPPADRALMDSISSKKLYVKTLDIGRNAGSGEIEPYAQLPLSDTMALRGLEVIPSIFITNEVFQNIAETKIEWLAGKISESLLRYGKRSQVLFDCDWTPSTREAFFLFLKKRAPNSHPAHS